MSHYKPLLDPSSVQPRPPSDVELGRAVNFHPGNPTSSSPIRAGPPVFRFSEPEFFTADIGESMAKYSQGIHYRSRGKSPAKDTDELGENPAFSSLDGPEIKFSEFVTVPWLLQFLVLIGTWPRKASWGSPRKIHLVIANVLVHAFHWGYYGYSLVMTDFVTPDIIVVYTLSTTFNWVGMLAMTLTAFGSHLCNFKGFFRDAWAFVHPEYDTRKLRSESIRVKATAWLGFIFVYSCIFIVADPVVTFSLSTDPIYYLWSAGSLLGHTMYAPICVQTTLLIIEMRNIRQMIDLNFDILQDIGGTKQVDFSATLNRFYLCHTRTQRVVDQYAERKVWMVVLIVLGGLSISATSFVYSFLYFTDARFSATKGAYSLVVSSFALLIVLVPLFSLTSVKHKYDGRVTALFKSKTPVASGLQSLHDLQSYVDRFPVQIEFFGFGLNSKTLLFTAIPLMLSTGFSVVKIFL